MTIRYDPRDLSEIRVFHQITFLCRAVSPEHAGRTRDAERHRDGTNRLSSLTCARKYRERVSRVTDFLPAAETCRRAAAATAKKVEIANLFRKRLNHATQRSPAWNFHRHKRASPLRGVCQRSPKTSVYRPVLRPGRRWQNLVGTALFALGYRSNHFWKTGDATIRPTAEICEALWHSRAVFHTPTVLVTMRDLRETLSERIARVDWDCIDEYLNRDETECHIVRWRQPC